jgi:hypothetical protein
MRTNTDLDAAFAELVRAADAAFPQTREPATEGPSPVFPQRWLLVAALVIVVAAMSAALSLRSWGSSTTHAAPPGGSAGAPPAAGFTGHWVSTDIVDGSAQTFDVSGSGTGGTLATRLHDTVATLACAGGPANVQGPGQLVGDQLFVTFTVSCPGDGRPPVRGRAGTAVYTYDPRTDTLTDDSGNVWHRA